VAGAQIERVGRLGGSITLRAGAVLIGCDRAAGSRGWCAGVVGLVRGGHLVDPRLSLTCRGASGASVGFAWIEPVRGASWLVVGRGSAEERYAASGGLPIRVATRDVELDSARFVVTQYGPRGDELERRRLLVHAAG
jgi:hypothetical protein